jgi:hypothetical protein
MSPRWLALLLLLSLGTIAVPVGTTATTNTRAAHLAQQRQPNHLDAAAPLTSDNGTPPPTTNFTCCVAFPIPGNETKAGCEAGGDARHDGGTYHWNTGRGTPTAACGQNASCDCCRIGPKPTRKGGKPICDPPSPPPGSDTNTVVFKHGGSPSLTYVPPGDPGAHSEYGTLLAFSGATRLVRSSDYGATWSAPSNPVAPSLHAGGSGAQTVYDPHRHTVFLQFGNVSSVKGGCDIGEEQLNGIKQLQSTDAGASWGSFVDVEKELVKEGVPVPAGGPHLGPGTCLGPTGGEALVMRPVQGKFGGRMVFCAVQNAYQGDIPVWSDDGGKTFNFSADVYKKGMDECSIAQAANGSLLLIARNCHSSNIRQCRMRRQLATRNEQDQDLDHRGPIGSHTFAVSMSHDGGEHWGPITQQPQLVTPICQASIISYKGPKDAAPALYFSHPYSTTSRSNGTILASDDNGATFSRSLNLGIPTDFGYTGLACGLVGTTDGTDCAVLYDAHAGALRLKRFASWNVTAVLKADDEEEEGAAARTMTYHNVLKTDDPLSDHPTTPQIGGPPRFFTFFGEPSWAASPPSFDVFNMQAALGVDQLLNLTQFRVPSNPNRAGPSFLRQNTSGVLFDLGDSGPVWGPNQPPGTPFWMQPGAVAWARNLTASTLRPLVKDGALRVIFLGDERLCSGVPAADVRALAAAVHGALNCSIVDDYGTYWPGLRRGIDLRLRERVLSACSRWLRPQMPFRRGEQTDY